MARASSEPVINTRFPREAPRQGDPGQKGRRPVDPWYTSPIVPTTWRRSCPAVSRPRSPVVVHALGALALLVAILGVTWWQRPWLNVVTLSPRAESVEAHAARRDVELRVSTPESTEKARLGSRAQLTPHASRARNEGPPAARLPVPARPSVAGRPEVSAETGALLIRCSMAVQSGTPESRGHRAANPVRGPPPRDAASI